MESDNTPRPNIDDLQEHRRRYLWHAGYDRDDEYEKHPRWAKDMRVSDEHDRTMIYDKFDPEHMWIKADRIEDLLDRR